MFLKRDIPDGEMYIVLDELIRLLDFCTVCHEVMLECYRCDIVIEKYCKDCSRFVDILDSKLPLSRRDSCLRGRELVVIDKIQVNEWYDCDVCMRKHFIKSILTTILNLHDDNTACSHCLALLNRPDCKKTRAQSDTCHCGENSVDAMSVEGACESQSDAYSDISMSEGEGDDEGEEFSSDISLTSSDIAFSASFAYLSYGQDDESGGGVAGADPFE